MSEQNTVLSPFNIPHYGAKSEYKGIKRLLGDWNRDSVPDCWQKKSKHQGGSIFGGKNETKTATKPQKHGHGVADKKEIIMFKGLKDDVHEKKDKFADKKEARSNSREKKNLSDDDVNRVTEQSRIEQKAKLSDFEKKQTTTVLTELDIKKLDTSKPLAQIDEVGVQKRAEAVKTYEDEMKRIETEKPKDLIPKIINGEMTPVSVSLEEFKQGAFQVISDQTIELGDGGKDYPSDTTMNNVDKRSQIQEFNLEFDPNEAEVYINLPMIKDFNSIFPLNDPYKSPTLVLNINGKLCANVQDNGGWSFKIEKSQLRKGKNEIELLMRGDGDSSKIEDLDIKPMFVSNKLIFANKRYPNYVIFDDRDGMSTYMGKVLEDKYKKDMRELNPGFTDEQLFGSEYKLIEE